MPTAIASGRQRCVRPTMDHSPAFERARGVGHRWFRPHPWTADHLAFEEKRSAGPRCRRQERAEFSDLLEPVVFPFWSCGYGGLLPRCAAGAARGHIHRMAGFRYQRGDQGQQRRELQIPADDPLFQLIFFRKNQTAPDQVWKCSTRRPIPARISHEIVPAWSASSVTSIVSSP